MDLRLRPQSRSYIRILKYKLCQFSTTCVRIGTLCQDFVFISRIVTYQWSFSSAVWWMHTAIHTTYSVGTVRLQHCGNVLQCKTSFLTTLICMYVTSTLVFRSTNFATLLNNVRFRILTTILQYTVQCIIWSIRLHVISISLIPMCKCTQKTNICSMYANICADTFKQTLREFKSQLEPNITFQNLPRQLSSKKSPISSQLPHPQRTRRPWLLRYQTSSLTKCGPASAVVREASKMAATFLTRATISGSTYCATTHIEGVTKVDAWVGVCRHWLWLHG